MLHQQASLLLQAGLKYFLDVDPSLTDHLSRNILNQSTCILWVAGGFIRGWSGKAADLFSPMLQEFKCILISSPEL